MIDLNTCDTLEFEISEIRKNGAVYTPSILAHYVAEKAMEYLFESLIVHDDPRLNCNGLNHICLNTIKIIDPACGYGELLEAAWVAFLKKVIEKYPHSLNISLPDPKQVLCGIDIDHKAIFKTKQKIASLSDSSLKGAIFNLIKTNALFPYNKISSSEGWQSVKHRFDASNGFDLVIANPPWGADTESYNFKFVNGDFSLYKGQFDTSDLFIELALSIVKPGGYFAFIVSDSLLNQERLHLRRMLLDQTEIKYVGRFGEKIFKNINRACVVIICRKGKAKISSSIDCMRLTPQLRKGILRGDLTFQDAERISAHKVLQAHFNNNQNYLFDIDVKEDERATLLLFQNLDGAFRDYLSSARGVELSKTGKVCMCKTCSTWLPYPKGKDSRCPHCKTLIMHVTTDAEKIISTEHIEGYDPILVGESVSRYHIALPFWIAPDKKGINYKDRTLYEGPKIVLRKTGVGLSAAIDYYSNLTNQVVYLFKLKPLENSLIPLEFFLAAINSRAIYYYLVKTYGETEWRSHPYLTQNQILGLPLPNEVLKADKGQRVVHQIAELLKPYLINNEGLPPEIDAKVEYLISILYGLTEEHYERIYEALDYVEELQPIKALKRVTISDIFNSR